MTAAVNVVQINGARDSTSASRAGWCQRGRGIERKSTGMQDCVQAYIRRTYRRGPCGLYTCIQPSGIHVYSIQVYIGLQRSKQQYTLPLSPLRGTARTRTMAIPVDARPYEVVHTVRYQQHEHSSTRGPEQRQGTHMPSRRVAAEMISAAGGQALSVVPLSRPDLTQELKLAPQRVMPRSGSGSWTALLPSVGSVPPLQPILR